jgi:7,8-dihydropterin-6-yl-methyl-4-(beta-D-ribofuranosyl)aminobenzene 5'-phosphate synthase
MQRSLASLATLALGLLVGTIAHAAPPTTGPAATSPVHAVKVTILSTMLAEEGIGEWGFAALVEVDGKKILYDTGARPRTVLDNARELHVELGDVEDVILSHFHDDHTTGLATLRRELAARNPAALSRVHVGKGIFQERRGNKVNPVIAMRKEIEATGARFIEHDKPAQLLPGVWLTGPIPRVTSEHNFPGGVEVARGTSWIVDEVAEDQALVIDAPRGLVVVTGCGHAGIVNIVQYARTVVRAAPVLAAIGGFHLFNAKPATIDWTADKLLGFQVAQVLAAHCTGIENTFLLRQRMGRSRQDVVVASVGATFDLDHGVRTGSIAQ